jgi:phosphohistidine phosphatase
MEIYVLRHGIAHDGKPGRPDAERALTAEGRDKLRAVLARARAAGAAPAAILTSPYVRAVETAEIAADVLGFRGNLERTAALEPDRSPYDVWDEIRARKHAASVLLAGHEPLLSALVAFLLGAPSLQVEMKKAALVRIDCDRFGAEPRGVLKWMLTPRLS